MRVEVALSLPTVKLSTVNFGSCFYFLENPGVYWMVCDQIPREGYTCAVSLSGGQSREFSRASDVARISLKVVLEGGSE